MSQRWESMFCLAALNTECVSITYSPILQFCLEEQSTRVFHQCPIYLDTCSLHNLTLHLSVTLVLIRERLNWGKVKMEHAAINWVWFIIHVVQYAVPMSIQHHVPEQDMHCRLKDFILTAEEREFQGQDFNVPMWMFILCTETSTPSQKLIYFSMSDNLVQEVAQRSPLSHQDVENPHLQKLCFLRTFAELQTDKLWSETSPTARSKEPFPVSLSCSFCQLLKASRDR